MWSTWFRKIHAEYGIKGVTVRNDNGSQFIANDVKQFLRSALAVHRHWYDTKRKHGQIGRITPQQKFDAFFNNFKPSGEADAGSAGEQAGWDQTHLPYP